MAKYRCVNNEDPCQCYTENRLFDLPVMEESPKCEACGRDLFRVKSGYRVSPLLLAVVILALSAIAASFVIRNMWKPQPPVVTLAPVIPQQQEKPTIAAAQQTAADALKKQQDDEARKAADVEARQKADDARKAAADALKKQEDDDARKAVAAKVLQDQKDDDARKAVAAKALQDQKDDDARKAVAAEALKKQQDDDVRKVAAAKALQKQQADDVRKAAAAEALQKQQDDDARKVAAAEALQEQKAAAARAQQKADDARKAAAAQGLLIPVIQDKRLVFDEVTVTPKVRRGQPALWIRTHLVAFNVKVVLTAELLTADGKPVLRNDGTAIDDSKNGGTGDDNDGQFHDFYFLQKDIPPAQDLFIRVKAVMQSDPTFAILATSPVLKYNSATIQEPTWHAVTPVTRNESVPPPQIDFPGFIRGENQ